MDSFYEFLLELQRKILNPDSGQLPPMAEVLDDILYDQLAETLQKKLKISKAFSDYLKLLSVFSKTNDTPDSQVNLYDFYEDEESNILYMSAVDKDGNVLLKMVNDNITFLRTVDQLQTMKCVPEMKQTMKALLHKTMCSLGSFWNMSY